MWVRKLKFSNVPERFLLVFTPLVEILQLFSEKEVFTASDMLLAVISGIVYFLKAVAFGYWFYNKRVYGPLIAKQKSNS